MKMIRTVPKHIISNSRVHQVLPVLKDIAKTAIKEKVIRVIIATFKVHHTYFRT
jgi:V-ATPase subunit H